MTVQKAIAELGMNLFVLESIVYYLAGLLDENLILATDIENSIVAVSSSVSSGPTRIEG